MNRNWNGRYMHLIFIYNRKCFILNSFFQMYRKSEIFTFDDNSTIVNAKQQLIHFSENKVFDENFS